MCVGFEEQRGNQYDLEVSLHHNLYRIWQRPFAKMERAGGQV